MSKAQAISFLPDRCARIVEAETVRSELCRRRILCRAWSDTLPEISRKDCAAIFARYALEIFARQLFPTLRLGDPFAKPYGRLDHAGRQLAETMGRDAAQLPILEGLHIVTSLYPAMLQGRERSRLGAFYTPPSLCGRLLDQATEAGVDWRTAKVLDPAAGGGAFLIQAAIRMREAVKDCAPTFIMAQIGSRLLGLEIDPLAAGLAQAALEILLADLALDTGRSVPVMVRVSDTLEEPAQEEFDLVIGNPPYGRITLNSEQRRRYSRSLYGHANLYGVFTDIALRWVKADGLVAYLTPASFLAGQYFAALRGLLAREAPPIAIDFVHSRSGVFEDVLQETLLAVYRKGAQGQRAQIHYLHIVDERRARVVRNGTVCLPADPRAPWLVPRDPAHSTLIRRVESMTARLSNWGYSVSTGPLVWNRFKPQLQYEMGDKTVYPLIWAEAVTADGSFIFRAKKKNHAPYFKLQPGDDWLLVEKPCVLVQRTTAKEQARRLIAAELPGDFVQAYGGVVVENHLNMVRAEGTPKVKPAVIAALLNSRVVDEVFRCMNGSVAVSAFELEALPLPDLAELETLKRLVACDSDRVMVEAECARLYGEIE